MGRAYPDARREARITGALRRVRSLLSPLRQIASPACWALPPATHAQTPQLNSDLAMLRDDVSRRMLAKVYRELMILGFISFGVVLCNVRISRTITHCVALGTHS